MVSGGVLLLPVLLPIACGIAAWAVPFRSARVRGGCMIGAATLCAACSLFVLMGAEGASLSLFSMLPGADASLAADGAGRVYGGMVAVFYVINSVYAVGYFRDDPRQARFFALLLFSMGVAQGIALARTPLTLYLFYEFLTFLTYPLITHTGTEEALAAGRKYLAHAFVGMSLAFVSTAILVGLAPGMDYAFGGMIGPDSAGAAGLLRVAYFVGFLGFGVKAAVFPLHGWLPSASVAPMPVTSTLHAMAVVKAGVFGILRMTYYAFGPDLLSGTWAQYACMALLCITVLYGAVMALRTTDLKRRLAYSTVAQLSCMLVPALMLTTDGLRASLVYMVIHAFLKSALFLGCGAILLRMGLQDVRALRGVGRRMPWTMTSFFIAVIGLTGVPGTAGFISKWNLARAAFSSGQWGLAAASVTAVIASTLLSALYLLPFCVKAFFPGRDVLPAKPVARVPLAMTVPVVLLAAMILLIGLAPGPLLALVGAIG